MGDQTEDSLFVCARQTVIFDKMQLFGLPNAAKDFKKNKKKHFET